MTPTTAPTLSRRILRVLGESAIPVASPDLVLLCADGLSHPRHRVWDRLVKLERQGLVRRAGKGVSRLDGPGGNQTVTLWALA